MSSGLSLVRLVPLAVIALFAGLGATVLLARAGEVRLIGYLRAEQSVVYAPHSGRVEAVQARSGESIKPRQPLIQLADESLDREISVKSREVTSLQASLEQCRAKAEVEMSLQRKDVDDALLRTRLEAAKFLRESYAAKFEHVTLRNLARESANRRWLAASPEFLVQPERIFDSIPVEPVAVPQEMKFSAVMRQELCSTWQRSTKPLRSSASITLPSWRSCAKICRR